MTSQVVHYTNQDFQKDLDSTRIDLVKFMHQKGVSAQPIFYTTERVCLEYLSSYYDICASATGNPTALFPTLDILKKGFENMTSRRINPDVAAVLISDPSIAVVEGSPENAGNVAKYDAQRIMDNYAQLVSQGKSELDAAYQVEKFSTGNPNHVDDIPKIISNTPRKSGFTLGDLV